MKNKDTQLLEEAYEKVLLNEDGDVGGNHWGSVSSEGKSYSIYVMDVIKAADKTVKAVESPIEQFIPPTNLRTPANVEKYKQDILAGKWKWTPVYAQLWQGKYTAYDGNHRIAAAIEANKKRPGIVKTIPVRDVAGIIDQTIKNFKSGKETVIGGVPVRIKADDTKPSQ